MTKPERNPKPDPRNAYAPVVGFRHSALGILSDFDRRHSAFFA
jgi:hypothetical protein